MRWRRLLATYGVLLALAAVAPAAQVSGELQRQIRAATFEVVLKKVTGDRLSYERALPLDLLPFIERTDAYWSIGTAFAIAPNTFVSAAHVMLQGIDSQFGTPSIRDAAGKVYAVDQVLKFSLHQDYLLFTVREAPAVAPLAVSREAQIDDAVFAVGNALGEGVVIRDGLYTSATPEDQDGRWKWIRFSAAASPGNSGGPLLNESGAVIGVVLAKSPNENLNFALPIATVLDAPERALFDQRSSFGLPVLQAKLTVTLKEEFRLPRSFSEFDRAYREVLARHQQASLQQLLTQEADSLFPKGNADELLASRQGAFFPQLISQDEQRVWRAAGEASQSVRIPDDGFAEVGMEAGVSLFRLRRPNREADAAFYGDSKRFMDLLLKGMKLPREVGSESILITSLGAAVHSGEYRDAYGRVWRQLSWPLGYVDLWVNVLAMPTPDGYVGFVQLSASSTQQLQIVQLKALSGFFQNSYAGTADQWAAFMANKPLLPDALRETTIRIDAAAGLKIGARRFNIDISPQAMALSDDGNLSLVMGYVAEAAGARWDVLGARVIADRKRDTYVHLERYARPGEQARRELKDDWEDMRKRRQPFDNYARTDADQQTYWISTVLDAGRKQAGDLPLDSQSLYVLTCSTELMRLPRELNSMQALIYAGVQIKER